MKTISKILYGILSFSIFAAYKIESAWAGWHVKLVSYASKCGSGTSLASDITLRDARFAIEQRTICSEGAFISACGLGDSFIILGGHGNIAGMLDSLAYSCRDQKYVQCDVCQNGGEVNNGTPTILNRPANGYDTYDVEICDNMTLSERFNVLTQGMDETDLAENDRMLLAPSATKMMQKYTIEFVPDAGDWVSVNYYTNCQLPPGEMQMDSGIMVHNEPCPYNNSMN